MDPVLHAQALKKQKIVLKRLASISDPFVRSFIDWKKLDGTGFLTEAKASALAYFKSSGDRGPLKMLVDLAPLGEPAKAMAEWVASATGGKFDPKKPHKVKKSKSETAELAEQQRQIDEGLRKTRDLRTGAELPVVPGRSGQDLLDSPARLPGSFGTGRRR